MQKLNFSFNQLNFGEEEAFHNPRDTYERLEELGYDGIEITPPKGKYGEGVKMSDYLRAHQDLQAHYDLEIAAVNECWGEEWDPFSPEFKTLTEKTTAKKAVKETKSTIDFASELGAPYVTVSVAVHDQVTESNVHECTEIAVSSLQEMADYAKNQGISLVFEAVNHLEMGRFINRVAEHKKVIDLTGRDNLGLQLDWFHVNIEELNFYEAVMDAGDLLWHLHFRDSNSLIPGYGKIDFKTILRGLKKIDYSDFCTIETAPLVPDGYTCAKDGLAYLKMMERVVDYQLSPEYPNGFNVDKR